MYELSILMKKAIQEGINAKITGKCTVNIINDMLIVDIVPKHLTEPIFRQTYKGIYDNLQHGVLSSDYVNAIIKKYKSTIYKRYFK